MMTVRQLIEHLAQLDQELPVVVYVPGHHPHKMYKDIDQRGIYIDAVDSNDEQSLAVVIE